MKKTKKVRVSRFENVRARKMFLILVGILIWMSLLTEIGIVYFLVNSVEFNALFAVLQTIIFISLVSGLIAVFKNNQSLHYLIHFGALINLILSIIILVNGNSVGLLQGLISFLILYLGIRFPLQFELVKSKFRVKR